MDDVYVNCVINGNCLFETDGQIHSVMFSVSEEENDADFITSIITLNNTCAQFSSK